jgi:hypothetical protein
VALATTVGVSIVFGGVTLLGDGGSLGDPSNNGSIGNVIQYLLVGVLIALAVKNYIRRETVEPRGGSVRSRGPTQGELSVSGSW